MAFVSAGPYGAPLANEGALARWETYTIADLDRFGRDELDERFVSPAERRSHSAMCDNRIEIGASTSVGLP